MSERSGRFWQVLSVYPLFWAGRFWHLQAGRFAGYAVRASVARYSASSPENVSIAVWTPRTRGFAVVPAFIFAFVFLDPQARGFAPRAALSGDHLR